MSSVVRALYWDDDPTTIDDATMADVVPNAANESQERPAWCRKQVAAFLRELFSGIRASPRVIRGLGFSDADDYLESSTNAAD
jgi:hypothetical protein